MSILVRKESGAWIEWVGNAVVQVTLTTATMSYGDGRSEEVTVPPYPAERTYNGMQLRQFYDNGNWTLDEIEAVGGRIAVPFEIPDGQQPVGEVRYEEGEDGIVRQVYDVEDIPAPPEPPTATEKFDAFLGQIGLTRTEFLAQLT